MAIKYSDVTKHYEDIKPELKGFLSRLEEDIIDERDEKALPVYLTKWRVKNANSIYLKTKRQDVTSLGELTDYGGLRVLCLFEQDILRVHKKLLEIFKGSRFTLNEFEIYNWNDKKYVRRLKLAVDEIDAFDGYEYAEKDKESGYKSLHYLISKDSGGVLYYIEVQLRTLLQDVWGELEHALAYKKGSIHPHISQSFQLLANELEVKDKLLRHLKDLADKEHYTDLFALETAGPYKVFTYEDHELPKEFFEKTSYGEAFKTYWNFIQQEHVGEDLRQWANKAYKLYAPLADEPQVKAIKANPLLAYWLAMEEAYLLFCQGKHTAALRCYKKIIENDSTHYVPYFRMGEVYFIQGEIEQALVAFDRSEELLPGTGTKEQVNSYYLKVKLANVYWLMGKEYYKLALAEALEAEQILNNNEGLFTPKDRLKIANNLCWYHLEMFIKENDDAHYEAAFQRFKYLEEMVNDKDASRNASSNMLDTLAWFCFQSCRLGKGSNWLTKSQTYCKKGWGLRNEATLAITSANMQRNHTQEIMSATDDDCAVA